MCGFIHASLSGSLDGYQYFGGKRRDGVTLGQKYVDGMSLTYRNPRNHIWTLTVSVNYVLVMQTSVSCVRGRS